MVVSVCTYLDLIKVRCGNGINSAFGCKTCVEFCRRTLDSLYPDLITDTL
jgi:hypothetical protein